MNQSAPVINETKKPSVNGTLFLSVMLTLFAYLVVSSSIVVGLTQVPFEDVPVIGSILGWTVSILGGLATVYFAGPIISGLMPLVAGLLQDRMASAIECKHYPNLPTGNKLNFWTEIRHDIGFTLYSLLWNILLLIISLIPFGIIYVIHKNAKLLGREFFESVGGRHIGKPAAKILVDNNRGAVYRNGLIIATLTYIPLVNLFVPFYATKLMVHLFQKIKNN